MRRRLVLDLLRIAALALAWIYIAPWAVVQVQGYLGIAHYPLDVMLG